MPKDILIHEEKVYVHNLERTFVGNSVVSVSVSLPLLQILAEALQDSNTYVELSIKQKVIPNSINWNDVEKKYYKLVTEIRHGVPVVFLVGKTDYRVRADAFKSFKRGNSNEVVHRPTCCN